MMIRLNTAKLRRQRHLTQVEISRRSGLSKTTISNLESGRQKKIELDTIAKLCKTLHCSPNDLFEWKENLTNAKVRSQKRCLNKYIGSIKSTIPFNPENLDKELSDLI